MFFGSDVKQHVDKVCMHYIIKREKTFIIQKNPAEKKNKDWINAVAIFLF